MPIINFKLILQSLKFKPDIFISFASPYTAQVAYLLRRPHLAFDDTEHSKYAQKLYRPFSSVILSPSCYFDNLHKRQILFNSYKELAYLHPNYFTPDSSVLKKYNINPQERYSVLRFVSWNANHDIGQKGLSNNYKINLVKQLSKFSNVYISAETSLPKELEEHKLNIKPIDFHHILAFASLYVGEGATTASECSVLGIPSIFINSLTVGYCKEQEEKYGLCHHFKSETGVLEKAIEILNDKNAKEKYIEKRNLMLKEKIDVTAFMIWFIENYPQSLQIMKENPDYQYNFK